MSSQSYYIIGLMSGTSCDGLDVVYAHFLKSNTNWSFNIIKAESYGYSKEWVTQLKNAHLKNADEINNLDISFAELSANYISHFLTKNNIAVNTVDAIASHGHTVFHKPDEGFTKQIGDGRLIKKLTGIPTIYDFRSNDVSLGGQGAPLVPIGDKFLFSEYDYCLNIGGIANVSYDENGMRKAYDICFVNMILNRLAAQLDLPFDKNGDIAKGNSVNVKLLNELLNLNFHNKSLAIEQYEAYIKPIIDQSNDTIENKIATVTEYAAITIAKKLTKGKTLVTGGGAYNSYLIDRIKHLSIREIFIPPNEIIEFKEALLFAFLGVLKLRNEPNCLASVTGAKYDNIGGVVVK